MPAFVQGLERGAMSTNPYDDQRSAPGVHLGTEQRPSDFPKPANPQARRNFLLLLVLTILLGILPAGALIYWGYFAPLTATCNWQMYLPGAICDYSGVNLNYSSAQLLSYEMFRQSVDRVIGPIWALLTLRFAVRGLGMQVVQNAPGRPIANDWSWAQPADQATYVRNRILSALTVAGVVICVLGVMVLLLQAP
jgi:hypothetical protein